MEEYSSGIPNLKGVLKTPLCKLENTIIPIYTCSIYIYIFYTISYWFIVAFLLRKKSYEVIMIFTPLIYIHRQRPERQNRVTNQTDMNMIIVILNL